jgi:hypothetical protein
MAHRFLIDEQNLKIMKKTFIPIFCLGLVLASCQKESDNLMAEPINQANSFEELKVDDSFTWSTEANYTLELKGLDNMPFGVKKQLSIETLDGKRVHTTLAEISQDRSLSFVAPAGMEIVKISFGSIVKESALQNGVFHFDFIPVDDTSDLDPDDQ